MRELQELTGETHKVVLTSSTKPRILTQPLAPFPLILGDARAAAAMNSIDHVATEHHGHHLHHLLLLDWNEKPQR